MVRDRGLLSAPEHHGTQRKFRATLSTGQSQPLADDQHQPASNVPALADAMRFRDFVEWVGSLDGKPKAPGFDKRPYFAKRVKSVAFGAAAESHPILFRSIDIGECHHILLPACESNQFGQHATSGDVE